MPTNRDKKLEVRLQTKENQMFSPNPQTQITNILLMHVVVMCFKGI